MGIKMSTNLPLVVILGSTGTGKTKLSLQLAKHFGGEIIGADSMQVYKQLDIASAKATKEEQMVAPHHMIDILEPHENFTVLEYRNRVLPLIGDIMQRQKLPVIVGGTNYYIESILWKILVHDQNDTVLDDCAMLPSDYYQLPSEELHKKLLELDPAMAKRLHPNNKRKIVRSLEVLFTKGKKHSEILTEQQSQDGASKTGGGLRFDNALVLWLQCNQDVLDKRLDNRVDDMLQQGLLDELLHFHKLYNEERLKNNKKLDYTKGIFQSIGFKEFHNYLLLSNEEQKSQVGQNELEQAVDRLKLVTRRFARKQTRWTVNRFLARKDRQVPPIYGLDTTDITKWDSEVWQPAFKIVNSFITKSPCDVQPIPRRDTVSVPNALDTSYKCEVCNRVFVGQIQWDIHLKSNKHKKIVKKFDSVKKNSDS